MTGTPVETAFRLDPGGDDKWLRGYQRSGRVPGGLFVHGFRSHCDGDKARALAQHAGRRNRAWLRFDQRGCGQSDGSFAAFTVTRAIEDSFHVLHTLASPTVMIGSSLGALVALELAQRQPTAIAALLLIAPAVRFTERILAPLSTDQIADWRREGRRSFADEYEGGRFELDYGFYRDAQNYARRRTFTFPFPVSILHGEQDELLPTADSVELQQCITAPSVTLDLIADGDHRLNTAIPLMCERLDQLWSYND